MRKLMIAAAAFLLPVSAHAATLITNGSFEDGIDPGSFSPQTAGPGAISGWVVGGSVDYIGTYWTAGNGARSVDLSGDGIGSLSQTFSTAANQQYRVTYLLAGNPAGGSATKTVSVSASGVGNVADVQSFDTTGASLTEMGWSQRSYTFTADASGSTTLSFLSGNTDAYGPALDNVAISAVPETATWAMMIGGFGLIGGAARTRRRQALATA